MVFKNFQKLNSHDFFNVVKKIYPKLKNYIEKTLNSFELNIDASNYFVDYFSIGHNEIHLILGEDYPCNKINILLNDLFFCVIKFDRNNNNYEIPDLFNNFHAVHYYHKIKEKINYLHKQDMQKEQIIDFFVLWERERHQKKECDCGENHEILSSDQLRELFLQVLEYYYSVNTNHFEKTFSNDYLDKGRNFLN